MRNGDDSTAEPNGLECLYYFRFESFVETQTFSDIRSSRSDYDSIEKKITVVKQVGMD